MILTTRWKITKGRSLILLVLLYKQVPYRRLLAPLKVAAASMPYPRSFVKWLWLLGCVCSVQYGHGAQISPAQTKSSSRPKEAGPCPSPVPGRWSPGWMKRFRFFREGGFRSRTKRMRNVRSGVLPFGRGRAVVSSGGARATDRGIGGGWAAFWCWLRVLQTTKPKPINQNPTTTTTTTQTTAPRHSSRRSPAPVNAAVNASQAK